MREVIRRRFPLDGRLQSPDLPPAFGPGSDLALQCCGFLLTGRVTVGREATASQLTSANLALRALSHGPPRYASADTPWRPRPLPWPTPVWRDDVGTSTMVVSVSSNAASLALGPLRQISTTDAGPLVRERT